LHIPLTIYAGNGNDINDWKGDDSQMRLPLYRAKNIHSGEWGIGYITKQYGS